MVSDNRNANTRWLCMKRAYVWILAALMAPSVFAAMPLASESVNAKSSSPIFGVTIPAGYRQWELIAPSHQTGSFNELRAIMGNPLSMTAYRKGTLPFPDGAFLSSWPGSASRPMSSRGPSSPARLRQFKSWSKTRKSTLPRAAGLRPICRRQT